MDEQTNFIPLTSSKGECNIPSYFVKDQQTVEKCTNELSLGLFKAALVINTFFTVIFFKHMTTYFALNFVIFHIFLYYFITNILVSISIGEWKTYQAYKQSIKKDPDFSRFDTPLTQFRAITSFLSNQPINKQKMMYIILIVSFLFVWLPIMFNIGGTENETRFDLSSIKKVIPFS